MKRALAKIHDISLNLLTPLTLEETYAVVCTEAMRLLKAHYCSIYLDQRGSLLKTYASSPELYNIVAKKNGYTYKAFISQKLLIVDIDKIEKKYPAIKAMGVQTSIFVPLIYQNKTTGVLVLQSLSKRRLTKDERYIVGLLSSLASLAIKKAQLLIERREAIEVRNQVLTMENTLEQINRAAIKFLEPLTAKDTYMTIVKEAIKLVDGDEGMMILSEGGKLKKVYASSHAIAQAPIRNKGFTYTSFRQRRALTISRKDLEEVHPQLVQAGIRSAILIPLSYKNKSIGVLLVRSYTKDSFANQQLHTLKLFGSLASLAIKKTQLYDETKKAVEVRDLFIAMAAHELRTPLTTINGYIQLLYGKLTKQKGTAESKWMLELYAESRRLTQLVHEFLEINRIRTGQFEYFWKECSIKEIIDRVLNTFAFTNPKRKIEVVNLLDGESDVVIGDFDKLIQVVSNIVENAAKYSSTRSKIVLRLQSEPHYLILSVEDRGKGMTPAEVEHMFDEFYRGDDSQEEGMGIGMFLTRNIIAAHHGQIGVESKIKKGTAITIKLPKAHL